MTEPDDPDFSAILVDRECRKEPLMNANERELIFKDEVFRFIRAEEAGMEAMCTHEIG